MISSPPGDEEAGRPQAAPERRGRPPVDGISVSRRRRSRLLTVLAVLVACYATGLLVNNLAVVARTAPIVDTIFPQLGRGDRLDLASIAAAWDVVRREYVYRDVDSAAATLSSERGIVDYLHNTARFADRFSAFYTKAQYEELQQTLSGERAGSIGIALEARCAGATLCPAQTTPTVVAIEDVLHGQPAEAAGLRNGDILLAVDGHDVASLGSDVSSRIDRAARLIRGRAGTQVSLTVSRGGRTLTVVVTRRDLHIPSVYSERFGAVLYLQVTAFDEGTGAALHERLRESLAAGARGVVLDLRANPGGLVSEAQAVASEFLTVHPPSEVDVVVRRGRLARSGDPQSAEQVDRDPILPHGLDPTGPLVVLVDGNTASAAEIVAAALHDYHRATVVGTRTFGKGSVQQDFILPDGSDLHLTIQKWFGPAGESIDGNGIVPDRQVALADEDHRFRLDAEGPPPEADAQLETALGLLGTS